MDLEERIARLIDPEAWRHWDECTQVWPNPYARPGGAFVADSREAARRVIDGLALTEEQRGNPTCAPELWSLGQQACIGFLMSEDCPHVRRQHRHVTPWEAQ